LAKGPDGVRTGSVGGVEVVAALGGIGPAAATATAQRLIATHQPQHVVVVGIAGGIRSSIEVGDLIVPEVAVDLETGHEYTASSLGDTALAGRLVTSEALIVDRSMLEGHAADGVDAIDMETAAVAAASEAAGLPWTAFRGISDHFADELMDGQTLGLMHEDGSPDLGAVLRYLVRRPANISRLMKLSKGTTAATTVATRALQHALTTDRG